MSKNIVSDQPGVDDNSPMAKALEQARLSMEAQELPIGAALEIDGEIVGVARNQIGRFKSRVAHAENILLHRHSRHFFVGKRSSRVLYSTFEPCLMCLTSAIHSGIGKIIYACPDPHGGSTRLPFNLPWYEENRPEIIHDPRYYKESAELIIAFARNHDRWKLRFQKLFEQFGEGAGEPPISPPQRGGKPEEAW